MHWQNFRTCYNLEKIAGENHLTYYEIKMIEIMKI